MDDRILKIQAINEKRALKEAQDLKHHEALESDLKTQRVILSSFSSLVEFLASNVSKTEVINQIEEVGTPDVLHVVKAIDQLRQTVESQKHVADITEVTEAMKGVIEQTRQLQAQKFDGEPQEDIDYTERFNELGTAISTVTKAIKAQKTTVQAPEVNVEAPDLKPISKDIEKVVKAVKAIVIPKVPEFDTSKIEKEQIKQTKVLKEILDRPVGGSSGGGGLRSTPYQDVDGKPTFISTINNALPVAQQVFTERFASSGGYDYVGEAPVGSSESENVWTISRYNSTSGKVAINVAWDDYLTETYA